VLTPFKRLQITTSGYLTQTFRDWGRANSFGGQSINAIISDNNTNQLGYQIMTGEANGEVIFRSAARHYITKGLQTNARYQFKTGAIEHSIELGLRLHQDQANRYGTQSKYQMTSGLMILTDGGEQGNQENQIRQGTSLASYLNYQLHYKHWTLNTGIRQEFITLSFLNYGNADFARTGSDLKSADNQVQVWLPGASLYYDLNERNSLFTGIHKGFSPPGMPNTTSGEQARAEEALNYELGYRLLSNKLQIQAALFRSAYQNLLGSDNISGGGLGTGNQFNAGKAMVQGLELSTQYLMKLPFMPSIQVPIQMNYTYTNATFAETFINGGGDWGVGQINSGDFIPFIAPHLLNCSVGLEHKKWNALLSANYVGTTRTTPGQEPSIVAISNENYALVNSIKGFTILDFSSNWVLNEQWMLYGSIQNIANNLHIVANLPQGYRSALPRTFVLGLKMKL
jgi:Fe(3+) dicitrate transport protein